MVEQFFRVYSNLGQSEPFAWTSPENSCDSDTCLSCKIFSNPEIVKVFHGCDYDILLILTDLGMEVNSFIFYLKI